MSIIQFANQRYATKAFDPSFKISTEQLDGIRSLIQLSPSSVNSQPWHAFLAVSEAGKKRISLATQGPFNANEAKVLNAAVVVALCARTDLTDDYLEQLIQQEIADGRFKDREAAEPAKGVRDFYVGHHRKLGDVAQWAEKQVYLNCGNLLLGVSGLALDAVPIEGFDQQVFDQEFNLAEKGLKSLVLVAIGKRAKGDFNAALPKSRWPLERIITEV